MLAVPHSCSLCRRAVRPTLRLPVKGETYELNRQQTEPIADLSLCADCLPECVRELAALLTPAARWEWAMSFLGGGRGEA